MIRHVFRALLVSLILSSLLLAVDPVVNSPLDKGTHPRLHITQDNIPEFKNAIATHYGFEFQQYVNWAASAPDNDDYNILSEAGHDPLRALMVHQAFIAALGPVQGISYPLSMEQYAARAINRLMSRLDAGDELSYVAALTYDWTYSYQTAEQRSEIASKMRTRKMAHKVFDISMANPGFTSEQMFSSKYFEVFQPWYVALAFWGDGQIDADAETAANTFYSTMLNYGYLDAHNFVAGDNGGWAEWVGYSSWHPRTHILNVDAWRTATGEDFIKQHGEIPGQALVTYPKFMALAMDPHKYFNDFYTYVKHGGAETTDPSLTHRSMREQILMLPRILNQSGYSNEAGLLHWFANHYEVEWPSYDHFYLWGFLGLLKNYPAKTPDELNLSKSGWSRNLGLFMARTGFDNPADGVFHASHGHFRFDGHKGADDFPGFMLAKFGTLVNNRNVAHRGYGNLDAYAGARQMNMVYFSGGHEDGHGTMDQPHELEDAFNGTGDYDWGGIEQVITKEDAFYHVRVNNNRAFSGASHTREYVWFPGANPANDSDFLVVYDRSSAPSDHEWVYHVPWKPEASGFGSQSSMNSGSGTSGRIGDAYTGENVIIKELNGLGGERDNDGGTQDYTGGAGAHGVAFVKTLLPQQAVVEVTRVAAFDSDVIKRQHHLAIKAHRWQVSVKPQTQTQDQHFLHVFQTADANKVNNMTNNSLVQVGSAMHGTFIQRENSGRPNYLVLFNQNEGVNSNVVSYTLNGQGATRHVITGLEPYTNYDIETITSSGSSTVSKVTEPDMELWDYKGVDTNTATGTLYFETTLDGEHTYKVSKSGFQDTTPPSKPGGFKIDPN